jgi:HlyD family secretion protein
VAPAFLDVRATRELEAQLEAAKAAVALAEAEINQAAAELEFAQSELKRAQSLIRNKTISDRDLERARIDADARQASLTRAKANLDVRKRELERAQARLIGPEEAWKGEVPAGCCVTVRAPVSGRVLRLIQESERVVAAGTPLLEIGDPDNLKIVVELLSADAVKVREGATGHHRWLGRRHTAHRRGHARRAGRVHQDLRARNRRTARAHHPETPQCSRVR